MKILGKRKAARLAEMRRQRDALCEVLEETSKAAAALMSAAQKLGKKDKELVEVLGRLQKLQGRYLSEAEDLLRKT